MAILTRNYPRSDFSRNDATSHDKKYSQSTLIAMSCRDIYFCIFAANNYVLKRIGLISDTHSYLDEAVFKHFQPCDEIWHAGDFGTIEIAHRLAAFKPLKGVYGNIDTSDISSIYPENLFFQCEDVNVFITHIGGYPPKYNTRVKSLIQEYKPQLFISGHSHILKVMYDDKLQCLHMNPGAAGNQGWHKVRTIITFVIDGKNMKDCKVIELGSRIKI